MGWNIIWSTTEKNYEFDRCVDKRFKINICCCKIYCRIIIGSNHSVYRMTGDRTSSIIKNGFIRLTHTDLLDKLMICSGTVIGASDLLNLLLTGSEVRERSKETETWLTYLLTKEFESLPYLIKLTLLIGL